MKIGVIFLLSICPLLIPEPSFADLTIEQKCHTTTKTKSMMTAWNGAQIEYSRKIFIKDNFLAIQLIVNDIPTKEYGFDFKSKIYYESDLVRKLYRRFLFSAVNQEYAARKIENMRSSRRMSVSSGASGSTGFVDYKISASRSIFRKKKIGTLDSVLYRIRIGPGYSPWRSLSWGKDITAWAAKDIPDHQQYKDVVAMLKRDCPFYLGKSNEISDFIITLINTDGFPLETHDVAQFDFGVGRLIAVTDVTFLRLDTQPVSDSTLSYFNDRDAFILNPDQASSGAAHQGLGMLFAEARNMSQGKAVRLNFRPEETLFDKLYLFAIPVLFYAGLLYYAFKFITRKTSAPLGGKLLFRFYLLVIFLYALQVAHIYIPYYRSASVEFSIIVLAGSALIIGGDQIERLNVRKRFAEGVHTQVCPHCRAVIGNLFAVCPRCNTRI